MFFREKVKKLIALRIMNCPSGIKEGFRRTENLHSFYKNVLPTASNTLRKVDSKYEDFRSSENQHSLLSILYYLYPNYFFHLRNDFFCVVFIKRKFAVIFRSCIFGFCQNFSRFVHFFGIPPRYIRKLGGKFCVRFVI